MIIGFWLFGWAGAAGMFAAPLTYVTFTRFSACPTALAPEAPGRKLCHQSSPVPEIWQRRNSDGDADYTLVLTAGGRDIVLKEGNDQPELERLRARLISEAHFQR